MKKFLSLIIVLFSFFVFTHFSIAAGPTPTPFLKVPGIDCGVSYNSKTNSTISQKNKCCVTKVNTKIQIPKPPVVGIDIIFDAINSFMNSIGNNIFHLDDYGKTIENINEPCLGGEPSTPGDIANSSCYCKEPTSSNLNSLSWMCDSKEKSPCEACFASGGIYSGMGCIRTDVKYFLEDTILRWGVGLAGGISLLCIIYAAFMMQTSQGNAEKIKKAQQMLTSCITGLMLIVFSVFILKLIGVDVLRIPGFI